MDGLGFAPGFFDRADPAPDTDFYAPPRLVTHIDDAAIAAVAALYAELGITAAVLGMNASELAANTDAHARVVHDLNAEPHLPFADESFDAAVCCVSVDDLVRPIKVFAEVASTLRAGAPFVGRVSNRCSPTKAIRGWPMSTDEENREIVARYFNLAGGFDAPVVQRRTPPAHRDDPLFAVWARRRGGG